VSVDKEDVLIVAGGILVALGVGMIYLPLLFVALGIGLMAIGVSVARRRAMQQLLERRRTEDS